MDIRLPCSHYTPFSASTSAFSTAQATRTVYTDAPLGSQIVPFPETPDVDMAELDRGFRGRRGRALLRESVSVTAASGLASSADWQPR